MQIPIDDVNEHLPSKPVNPGGVLECELSANNYREKFNTLIACEQSTHEEFLKRCVALVMYTYMRLDRYRVGQSLVGLSAYCANHYNTSCTYVYARECTVVCTVCTQSN